MNTEEPIHAVIDTNAVLDWLLFREAAALALGDALSQGRWVWLASPRMLDELRAVLGRPLADRWEAARKHALTISIEGLATLRPDDPLPAPPQLICRDPDDQKFIDLALRCTPAWLITRDRALLALRRRAAPRGVVIATPAQWQRQHNAASTGVRATP